MEKATDVPVLFITQVIGLALGIPEKKLGLARHFVPVKFPAKPVATQVVQ
jgi:heterodisulfide reductase subunit B